MSQDFRYVRVQDGTLTREYWTTQYYNGEFCIDVEPPPPPRVPWFQVLGQWWLRRSKRSPDTPPSPARGENREAK